MICERVKNEDGIRLSTFDPGTETRGEQQEIASGIREASAKLSVELGTPCGGRIARVDRNKPRGLMTRILLSTKVRVNAESRTNAGRT